MLEAGAFRLSLRTQQICDKGPKMRRMLAHRHFQFASNEERS